MRWHVAPQQIYKKSSVALSDAIPFTFENLRTRVGRGFGHVIGLILAFEGYAKESASSAAMAKTTAWGILNSINLTMPAGPWCTQVTGRDMVNYLLRAGFVGDNAADQFPVVDLSQGTAEQACNVRILIPLAPKAFSVQGAFDDASCLAGAVPAELLRAQGSGQVNIVSTLGGNWVLGVTNASNFSVYALVAYTTKPVAYCPSAFYAHNSNESTVTLNSDGRLNSLDFLAITDDAYSTLTAPTEPRVECDDVAITHLVSGAALSSMWSLFKESKNELYADDGETLYLGGPAVHCCPAGYRFKVINAAIQQTSAVRYMYHQVAEPEIGLTAEALRLEGVPAEQIQQVISDYSSMAIAPIGRTSRVLVSGVPAGLQVGSDERAARAVVLDVTRSA